MFIGAAVGIAASGSARHDLAPAIAMGIGAMCAAMLRLPLTSTLLATLLLGIDGVIVTPQVVVAVAVAFVITQPAPTAGSKHAGVTRSGCNRGAQKRRTSGSHRIGHLSSKVKETDRGVCG